MATDIETTTTTLQTLDFTQDNPPHATCSFCGSPRSRSGPMVEGPHHIYMCAACVDASARIVAELRRIGRLPPATEH